MKLKALTLSESDITTWTDHDLESALGVALVDDDQERLVALKAERKRRREAAEDERLARLEQERRQRRADEAERDMLLATLTQQLADLEAEHRADLAELERTPQSQAYPICARAYHSGRVAFSFAHDLHGITGDPRVHRMWSVSDQITLCGGAAGEAFMLSIRGKPPVVETPGRADLARLRELCGSRVTAIGG